MSVKKSEEAKNKTTPTTAMVNIKYSKIAWPLLLKIFLILLRNQGLLIDFFKVITNPLKKIELPFRQPGYSFLFATRGFATPPWSNLFVRQSKFNT